MNPAGVPDFCVRAREFDFNQTLSLTNMISDNSSRTTVAHIFIVRRKTMANPAVVKNVQTQTAPNSSPVPITYDQNLFAPLQKYYNKI